MRVLLERHYDTTVSHRQYIILYRQSEKHRLVPDKNDSHEVITLARYLADRIGRLRDVMPIPDGALYLPYLPT